MEYEKYQELQAKSHKMQEDYERQLQEMEDSRQKTQENTEKYYKDKIDEHNVKLKQVK